jgi:Zn-dependent membrane protease YugP/Tfp pilus assembly protein PilF
MDLEDLVENVDQRVLTILIPLGMLAGAMLVQRAAKRFQRLSEEYGLEVSACGLTGEHVARRLLTACGLDDVAVALTTGRDLYHPLQREVQLSTANFSGRSLAALAIAAHEVGHAQQYASKRYLYRLRLTCRRVCQALAVAALTLLVAATVLPLRNVGSGFLVLTALAVGLQTAATLPLEHDASRRARELVRNVGLIAPEEAVGFDRLLNAAWLTYAAAEARRSVGLLLIGVLTVVWYLDLAPARLDGLDQASQELVEGVPPERFREAHNTIIRLVPLFVIGYLLLQRLRTKLRARPSRAHRAAERNNAALASYQQGDFATAVRQLNEAIALTPGTAITYINRGSTYLQLAQRDRALADFDRALALDPNLPEVRRIRGNLWLEKHDYDRALADFDAAVALAPTVAAAWRDRGLTLLWRGEFDRALADLDEAIRLDATDAVAFNNRGVVRIKRGEPAQARADLEEAIRLDPNLPNPRKHLATLDAPAAVPQRIR